jgi:outer membrane protein assembly factor BamB
MEVNSMTGPSKHVHARLAASSLLALSLALTATGLSAAQGNRSPGAAIPTYRGDAARTGVMPGPGPGGAPAIVWQFQTPRELASSPTVLGDVVHLVGRDGYARALDLADGLELWATDLGARASATPLEVEGTLVIADETGVLHGLVPEDGRIAWRLQLDGPVTGAPASDGTLVVVATQEGTAYGIDPTLGTEVWQVPVGGGVRRSVAIADGVAYLGTMPGTLVALATASGRELWRRQVSATGDVMSPSVADGRVFVTLGGVADGRLIVLAASSGEPLWSDDAPPGVVVYAPAIADGRAIVVRTDGIVEALDAESGASIWSARSPNRVTALPAIVDDTVLVAAVEGPLQALDLATGATRWSVPIDGAPFAPVAIDGVVLVPTGNGTLYAIATPE